MLGILRNKILSLHYLYEHVFTIPIFVDITDRCNRDCSFCFRKNIDRYGDITINLLDRVINILSSKEVTVKFRVILFGGEPTLRSDLCKYALQQFKSKKISVGIFTNGWWIDNIEQYNWIFDRKYKPNTIYCSINNELPGCMDHYYMLSKYCTRYNIALFADVLGEFPIMESHCKRHGHFLCKDTIKATKYYEEPTNNIISRDCGMSDEGINILVNGDTYLSCDYMQCKLRGIEYLLHDLNSIPLLRKRLIGCREAYKCGTTVTCGIHANKILEQL